MAPGVEYERFRQTSRLARLHPLLIHQTAGDVFAFLAGWEEPSLAPLPTSGSENRDSPFGQRYFSSAGRALAIGHEVTLRVPMDQLDLHAVEFAGISHAELAHQHDNVFEGLRRVRHERTRKLLLSVAPHVHIGHQAHEFIAELSRLAEQNPDVTIEVLDAMIAAHVPEYDYQDTLQKLLNNLARMGKKNEVLRMLDRLLLLPSMHDLFNELAPPKK